MFSNILRFCSSRPRTEQHPCLVRVLQVRTMPSEVEDHRQYVTDKWIRFRWNQSESCRWPNFPSVGVMLHKELVCQGIDDEDEERRMSGIDRGYAAKVSLLILRSLRRGLEYITCQGIGEQICGNVSSTSSNPQDTKMLKSSC
jgi:hypothetical protein